MVPMIQALAKHIEQLVAMPDELRLSTIRKLRNSVIAVDVSMNGS